MKSGLLDRAETVFTDLRESTTARRVALRHLIAIYQSERDWNKAIENAGCARPRPARTGWASWSRSSSANRRTAPAPPATPRPRARRWRAPTADATRCARGMLEGGSRPTPGTTRRRSARSNAPRTIRITCRNLPTLQVGQLRPRRRRDRARNFLSEMSDGTTAAPPVLALTRLVEGAGASAGRAYPRDS